MEGMEQGFTLYNSTGQSVADKVQANIVDYCQSIVKGKESTELLTKGENFDSHKYICTTFIMY